MTLDEKIIAAEYEALCGRLGLEPVVLDVYRIVGGSHAETDHGTKLGNAAAAYGRGKVAIPLDQGDVVEPRVFPPADWRRMSTEWPTWRIDLWHEVCHQVQDRALGLWDPNDGAEGHRLGWAEARELVAAAMDVDTATIEGVT